MRNAKLWSVLLAAVLVCACIAGVLFTGASASDTRVPEATTTYVVGTDDGNTIRACLEKAAGVTWAKDTVLKIQFSGTDTSAYSAPDAANGVSGYTLFEVTTIFREDDTQLPIIIEGVDTEKARDALIKTAQNDYCATNDYFFVNLTMNGGLSGKPVRMYAGSGELVFENCNFNNFLYTYYYGDNLSMDSYEGWDADKVAANANEKGLVETGIIFGHGCGDFYAGISSGDKTERLSAVGYDGSDAGANDTIFALKRKASDVKTGLTDDQLAEVKEAAKIATFKPGNVVKDAIVKPWDTASHLILDNGKVGDKNDFNYGVAGARKGVSPVREARVELHSGCAQYLIAVPHTSDVNETYAGDTSVIVRGGTNGSNDVGIRMTNVAMLVGNLTLEVHEDNPEIPTKIDWIQTAQSSTVTSTIYGNYHFLMTGGTIGRGYSTAKVNSAGDQVVESGKLKWDYSDGNDGYWGAPLATGTIINEVRGGKLWAFYGTRYGNTTYENTPVSTMLPGVNETLEVKVSVLNKISGGEFGGPVVNGTRTDSTGNLIDVQTGTSTKGFWAQGKGSYAVTSVCNEITGGTFYNFGGASSTASKVPGEIYNFISGTAEQYPTFLTHFYGSNSTVTTPKVTNVIKGYPVFKNLNGEKLSIYGGCKNGTVTEIVNYLGGMPVFDDFYGGCSGTVTPSGNKDADYKGVAGTITNTIALDMTESSISNYVWGGNGYHTIAGVDGAAETLSNSECVVTGPITCNIYSAHFGTFRAESACGKTDNVPLTVNVYGGKWSGSFMVANRTVSKTSTAAKDSVVTTNIYDGTFNGVMYMGGQNSNNRELINNIYGGTFTKNYYGGGGIWAGEITNNIYGGTFTSYYYGGGSSCGSRSITNNIYGGTFSGEHDYMGTDQNPTTTTNIDATQTITNNFYGGDFGKGWTYGGHKNGTTGTITNYFHSGEDNPVRDPENDLYKYFDATGKTTLAGGTYFRDQVVCGIGYTECSISRDSKGNITADARLSTNKAESITNTFEGGLFDKSAGGHTGITIHGGMRYGIAGSVTNNFVKGTYYRVFGGSDFGFVTGTITNNFGQALEEGETASELKFTSYTYGGGLEAINIGSKIDAALKVEEASRTDLQKMWAEIAETYGEDIEAGAKDLVNNVYYGTFTAFYAGSRQDNKTSYQGKYDTVTNNVYGGTFNKPSDDSIVFAGGMYRNGIITTGIFNNINGGTFNGNFYGGSVGIGAVSCPAITNVINGGEGNKSANAYVYFGNGAPTYNGTVTTTVNDFTAHKTYVMGGSTNVHNQPEGVDFGIVNTINGGTFSGFWGLGGGSDCKYTGNVKTIVNGGTFNPYASNMPNSFAGGPRNGTLVGNIETVINDGTFVADVVGGTIWGSESAACKVITGNVKTTIKGGSFEDIYPLSRYSNLTATGTVTLEGVQTEGKALKFTGQAPFTSFASNGDVIEIGAQTNIIIGSLTGKINVKQTEGWKARNYMTLPAGSEYSIDDTERKYGAYVADDTILVKGYAVAPTGATIRLADRLGVRILLNQDDVELFGEAFTYSVKLGDTTVATGTYEDIKNNNYSILFDGIGLNKFGETFTVTSPAMAAYESSIVDLATLAKGAWTGNWLGYANAIIEFDNVYNKNAANTMAPAAVANQCVAARGEADDIANANVTLLMSDAAGLKLTVGLNAAHEELKVLVNGTEVAATVAENTVTAEMFFAHEYLAETFVVSVESKDGVHMTYTASIEALANQLANDAANENKNNATAFLCYIQKAVACK